MASALQTSVLLHGEQTRGELTFQVGAEIRTAGPGAGDLAFAPRRVPPAFANAAMPRRGR